MKKLVLYFLLLFPVSIVNADINLAYLDIQYIIDNSNLGQIYKKNLKEKSDKFKSKLSIKEDEYKKLEVKTFDIKDTKK